MLHRYKIMSVCAICAAVITSLASCGGGKTLNAADFGLQQGIDNTPTIMKAIEACREQGASKLIIPKGVYDLYPERAHELYRNISNNDDGKKRIVFLLDEMEDFEIDGSGSQFICHDHMMPFCLFGTKNVALKNFSVDWAKPFYLQAQVVAVHPSLNAFDMKILDECDYEIQGDNLIFSNKKTEKTNGWHFMAPPAQKDVIWEQNLNWNIWYDPQTKAPAYCDENTTRVNVWNTKLNKRAVANDLGARTVRLTDGCEELPQIGWVLVSCGILTKNRLSPVIYISHSKDLLVENVTVHHANGMALIAERTENVTLNHYNVLLPENSERLVTSSADATHFVSCKGKIVLDGCIFENMLDDGTNVHGIYAEIRDVVDPYTLGMSRGHSQQQGFDFAQIGDQIALVDRSNLKPYSTVTVASVKNVNDFYFEVTFKEKVEELLKEGSVADNLSWQPEVIMRNCEVRQNRARGILISTAGKVLVENNRFVKCTYAGILNAADANYWFESGPIKDLVMRNNVFEDQGLCVGNAPVVAIIPEAGNTADTTWYYHENIIFENNTINSFSRVLVQASSIKNFVFRNNVINRSVNYKAADDNLPAFIFNGCRDVTIEGNKYLWGKTATISAHNCVDVNSSNNENIENLKK